MNIKNVTVTAAICALAAGGTGAAYAASASTTPKSPDSSSSSSPGAAKRSADCRGPRDERPGRGPFADIASALGIKPAELQKQLRSGKKLSAIATAQGKTLDEVKAAVKASLKTQLDKAVKGGKITQTQADERLSHVDSVIDDIEEGNRPEHGRGHGDPVAPGGPPPGA